MKQILQNLSNGETLLENIPCPLLNKGYLLIAARNTLLSNGTERMLVEFGKANFIVLAIPKDTPIHRARRRYGERLMTLMTTRSHDQYNTTIYGLDDRYRGVFGQRRVIFIHKQDLELLGFKDGEWVDLVSVWDDGIERRADGFLLVEYDIPRGCIAGYYPETNPLVPLESFADKARTPTSKSIPVLLSRAAVQSAKAA